MAALVFLRRLRARASFFGPLSQLRYHLASSNVFEVARESTPSFMRLAMKKFPLLALLAAVAAAASMHTIIRAQGHIPIELIGERVPGESHNRDAVIAQAEDIRPFFLQPKNRLLAGRTLGKVGLRVHDG